MITIIRKLWFKLILAGLALALLAFGAWGIQQAAAMRNLAPAQQASPLHPTFALLDQDGTNVLESGKPLSTMKTCGQCHNADFIESHAFHADLGLSDYTTPGQSTSGTAWDTSNGLFGKFDPLTYRYLSPVGDQRLDLSTADWLMEYGWRVSGGGPATTSRSGGTLTSLSPDAANPEASHLDPQTGKAAAWDWSESGVIEMNCFLCHTTQPNNDARIAEIKLGNFGQANTATLLGTGIVDKTTDGWAYNPQAFDETGHLKSEFVQIQDPSNANCAQCHGTVHEDPKGILLLNACDTSQTQTATTGQVIASQRINESGLNLADKASLSRSWDVHAERALECTDCHYAPNNPAHYQEASENKPAHLTYDPRRLDIGEYLSQPDHNFARGQSAQYSVSPEYKGTMRRCESCHEAEKTHATWLPYTARHMAEVACETCHIPQLYAPAIESYDWTVVTASGTAVSACRGIDGTNAVTDLVTGYQPVLMQRSNIDGGSLLAPYNLITTWFWIYDGPSGSVRPVRKMDLQAAFLQGGYYDPVILDAFDANSDGLLDANELKIDSEAKESLIAGRLSSLGLQNPRIYGQVQPYSINHNVARGDAVISDCQACHSDNSRITASMQLASNVPGGVMPEFVQDTNVSATGELTVEEDGSLVYQPVSKRDSLYIFGQSRVSWVDWLGGLAFLGVLLAVAGHGTLRYLTTLRKPRHALQTQEVYMYEPYERFWHWLQTFTIIFLLFTGLVIHRPDMFGIFSFPYMVTIHNVLAAILVINAALSLFWHLVSGEVRQFIPHPYGFFDDAIVQAKFYIQGIFKGDPHPFQKTRGKKLNPLQQVTYFGLLNVLLPLQIITGALMWGVQQWPQIAGLLGGLPFLAPFHSLVAWLFGAFIVAHVYLTTTGATVFENIKAMITGWEKVTVHETDIPEAQATGG